MPFREKSAWISLLATTGVWGTYFWIISQGLLERGSLAGLPANTVGLFIGGVVAIVIIQIILAIAVAVVSGRQADTPMDERERLIDLKAARAGFYALNGAAFCVSGLWLAGASPLVMANGILLAMVVGEVVHSGGKIVGYRRGSEMAAPPPIRNQIRRLRFDHGEMTQQALAEAIGMTRQTIVAIEQGKYSPSLEAAFRISRVFGVGVEDVFDWEG